MHYTSERAETYVRENHEKVDSSLKPFYHLTPPIGWLNDPNGVCFDGKLYHMFFQFHPYHADDGPKHWAHYTSEDMLKWQWNGIPLAPDQPYDLMGCWSGTALPENGSLRIMYTGVRMNQDQRMVQEQCLAVLKPDGTMTKHPDNPVIHQQLMPEGYEIFDFRDPRIFKDAEGYGVYVSARGHKDCAILEFRSNDGVNWKYTQKILSGMKAMPECPDIFHLCGARVLLTSALDLYEKDNEYCGRSPVLYGIGEQFDPESLQIMDKGLDYYAPQTIETHDGRRVVFAWMRDHHNDAPSRYLDHGWNGLLALPRELSVKNGQLIQQPLRELYTHLHILREFSAHDVEDTVNYLPHNGEALCMQIEMEASEMELRFFEDDEEYVSIRYRDKILTLDRSRCGYRLGRNGAWEPRAVASTCLEPEKGKLSFEIWLDRGVIELFSAHGKVAMSALAYVKNSRKRISIHSPNACRVNYVRIWKVDSLPITLEETKAPGAR